MLTQKQLNNFWKKVDVRGENDCWNWNASLTSNGYGQFIVGGKNISAHRISFFLHFNELPKEVRHTCDNKQCCNPKHLVGGTHYENMTDMQGKERTIWKLTQDDVNEIRRLYFAPKNSRKNQTALAIQFGVSQRHIGYIVSGRSWKLLPEN